MGKTINYYTDENGKEIKEVIITKEPVGEKVKKGFEKVKEKTVSAVKEIGGFVADHPLATLLIVSSSIKLLTAGANAYAHCKNANSRARELDRADDREQSVYDRRNGIYYMTRRPMTTAEKIELSNRRRNGEDVGDILSDMNLI